MESIIYISINILKLISRTPFYWAWNILVLLLVLSLNYVTFFDFEGNSLVLELFFSTLILSGAVNAFVFHLTTSRALSRRQWDLLLIRPINARQIVFGNYLGILALQLFVGLLFTGMFLFETRIILGHRIESPIWPNWSLAMLQIAMLTGLYGLFVIWMNSFWASIAMIGIFLLGHLSFSFRTAFPEELSFLTDLIFTLVPDLGIPLPVKMENNLPETFSSFLIYSVFYLILTIYASAISLKPSINCR